MIFAVKVFDVDGALGVCGAWSTSPDSDRSGAIFNDRLLQSGRIEIDGEILMNDISFFTQGGYVQDHLPTGEAACRLTDTPWNANYPEKTRFEFARNSFVHYD